MVEMTARRDYEYDNAYNRALQSRIYNSLDGTEYAGLHENDDIKLFSYSPPIPPRDAEEGDTRRLIVAGQDDNLVTTIITNLCQEPELNLREMPFHVNRAFSIDVPLGNRGALTTGSPIIIRFDDQTAAEYGIDAQHEKPYWEAEHGTNLFFDHLNKNIQQKYRIAYGEEPPEPPYFTGYSFDREVVKPLYYDANPVTYVGNEWTFEYEIESGDHRKLLNLALNTGLGELNGLGFGFMNREEDVNDGTGSSAKNRSNAGNEHGIGSDSAS
jgi:CRISPR-associated endoribonuclease Cas6